MGIDSEANLVVIELKRMDGGDMDLQAVRYAAMVSAMTFDDLVGYYAKFLKNNNYEGDADAKYLLYEFLDMGDSDVIELQTVKIVLAAQKFSKELTTSVLWLNEQKLDIRCVRLHPYNNNGQILMDVQTIIPLPETHVYQTQLRRHSEREQKWAKKGKVPKYNVSFGGKPYLNLSKRKLMYTIFSELFENDENPENIMQILPSQIQVFNGLLEDEEVRNTLKLKDKGAKSSRTTRFFCENNEPVQHRGKTYVLSNQWGKDTLDLVKGLVNKFPNHNIKVSEADPD